MAIRDEIYIRALSVKDVEIYKPLHLEALKTESGFFSSRYEDALKRSPAEWKEILSGTDRHLFAMFLKHPESDMPIGLTGLFANRDDPQTGELVHSFILPYYRGRGLSDLFYRVRLELAMQHSSFLRLKVSHRAGNEPSRRAILRHGFTQTHKTRRLWPDGVEEEEWHYTLDLVPLRAAEKKFYD